MPPDRPLPRLDELARAVDRAGLTVEEVDRILTAQVDPKERDFMAAAYGAWIGELARKKFQARWVGLFEPVAPRLEVMGLLVSPINAVQRRLENPAAPSIATLFQQLETWVEEQTAARAGAASKNREAWDQLSNDPRYSGPEEMPEDPSEWLDDWLYAEGVKDKDLLCLGAGGGRQGPLHARAGARVTVVDVSEAQLEHDRRANLRTLAASIDDLSALEAASFDIVLQPVSAGYVPDVAKVYAQVARVLRKGGLYVVQHKQPASLQGGTELTSGGYALTRPATEGAFLPPDPKAAQRDGSSVEFIHTLDALLGGLCRAGFTIEDCTEPPRADAWAPAGSAAHRARYLPPYLRIKARRV